MTITKDKVEKVIQDITRYYESDIDNCIMTNGMWILELAKCMLLPEKYKKDLYQAIKEYDKMNCKDFKQWLKVNTVILENKFAENGADKLIDFNFEKDAYDIYLMCDGNNLHLMGNNDKYFKHKLGIENAIIQSSLDDIND